MGDRWGSEGPPPEAYSRVSDPHRYDGLHDVARELVLELEQRYAVERTDATEVDDDAASDDVADVIRVLTLTPDDPRAAPVSVVLTSRPGLLVRAGRIPDGGGHRFLGRAAGRRHRNQSTRGYHFLHTAVDDHSRLAYAESLTDERKETAAEFWTRAAHWFSTAVRI